MERCARDADENRESGTLALAVLAMTHQRHQRLRVAPVGHVSAQTVSIELIGHEAIVVAAAATG
jgi:hypothetical protein